ncbi:hypothetical protein EV175_003355 [Coemansia sp. RSA 1933]|nr:hypothetical protein EV175_003355 [Coemansia sp. RSA 1933]
MARAANLLPEIIRLILRAAAASSASETGGSTLAEWKQNLPLLGVCHRWRALGVPLVYSQVIVESSGEKDSDEVITNAELFGRAHGQPTDMARRLMVSMAAHAQVGMFLGKVCDSLVQSAYGSGQQWRRVHTVTLDLCAGGPYMFASTPEGNNAGAQAKTPRALADRLARVLPGVQTLHCAPSQNIGDCAEFTACFADNYAHRIERLKTHVHAPFTAATMPNLRMLDLFFFLSSVQLSVPRVDARLLRRMSLVNVSAEFAWGSLFPRQIEAAGGAGKVAMFESLRRMHLFFHTHVDVFESNTRATELLGAQYWRRLSFPELQNLCTDNSASAATLLGSAHFPDRVAEFRVFFPEGAIISIKNADFSADARRRIAAHMAGPGDTQGPWDFVRLTNCIFTPSTTECSVPGDSKHEEDLSLTIGAHMFLPKPSVIAWSALTRLSIGAPICPFALAQYIGALSGLLELRVHSMQLGAVILRSPDTNVTSGSDDDNLCLWPPSSAACSISKSPIRFLALAFDVDDNGDIATSVVEHLASGLPCIHTLCIPDPVVPRIQAFAASQHAVYPHLANLSVH